MGVIMGAEFRIANPDESKQPGDFARHIRKIRLMELEGFRDLKADREDGIEGGRGLLKNVGEFPSPGLAKGGIRTGKQVGAVLPENLAGEAAGGRRGSETGQGQRGCRFSRAAFPNDGNGFPRGNGKRQVFDGHNRFCAGQEFHTEVADIEKGVHLPGRRKRGSTASRKASPSRLNAITVRIMATPGVRSHQKFSIKILMS